MSKSKDEKPFVFYFAPVNQDIDRMLDENYCNVLTLTIKQQWDLVGTFIDVQV